MKKILRPIFSRIIKCDKPQGTIYNGLEGTLTSIVHAIRTFCIGIMRWLKTQILEKRKAIFPVKRILWPIFSRIIECDKTMGTICNGSTGILTITVEDIRSFL